jgi:hypothetical protein
MKNVPGDSAHRPQTRNLGNLDSHKVVHNHKSFLSTTIPFVRQIAVTRGKLSLLSVVRLKDGDEREPFHSFSNNRANRY